MDASKNAGRDSSQSLQASLQAGLAALKQKDYSTTIAHLSACQTSPDTAIRLKAEMGLIKAYVGTGKNEAAIALCQPLQDHPNPQVQAWVKQTLTELRGSSAPINEAEPSDATGFVPLSSTPHTASKPDQTGFVRRVDAPRTGSPHIAPHTGSPPAIPITVSASAQKSRSTNRSQPPQTSQAKTPPPPQPPSFPSGAMQVEPQNGRL